MAAALFTPATLVDQVRDKNRVREVEATIEDVFPSLINYYALLSFSGIPFFTFYFPEEKLFIISIKSSSSK